MNNIHTSLKEVNVVENTRSNGIHNGYYSVTDSTDLLGNEMFIGIVSGTSEKQLMVNLPGNKIISHNNIRKYIEDENNIINDSLKILDNMGNYVNGVLAASYDLYGKEIK